MRYGVTAWLERPPPPPTTPPDVPVPLGVGDTLTVGEDGAVGLVVSDGVVEGVALDVAVGSTKIWIRVPFGLTEFAPGFWL